MDHPLREETDSLFDDPALLPSITTTSPHPIAVAVADGRILLANHALAELLGYDSAREMIGKDIFDFLPSGLRQETRKDGISRLQEICSIEHSVPRPDGATVFFDIRISLLDESHNQEPRLLIVARDLTWKRNVQKMYEGLLDKSLQGIAVFQDQRLVYINRILADILGHDPQTLMSIDFPSLMTLVHPDDLASLKRWIDSHDSIKGNAERLPFRILRQDGKTRWLEMMSAASEYNGRPAIQVSIADLTQQKQAQAKLFEAMTRYQVLAESSQDSIYIIDRENHFLYVNSHGAALLGKPPEQIIGQPREKLIPSARGRRAFAARQKVFGTGQPIQVDDRAPTINGPRWFSYLFVPLKDVNGSVTSVMGIARDIDERKKLELQLKRLTRELEKRVSKRTAELKESQKHLQALTHQIVNAQEEERRRIARELHDEAGQALISLKMGLFALLEELPESYPLAHAQPLIDLIDQTTERIRNLAHSLRPPVLDVAGLNLSLQEYCREFFQRTRLPVEYRGIELPNIPEEISISLFRFLQEALTNVVRHAGARSVQVELEQADGCIRLKVSDDGRGFDPQRSQRGLGLSGMQERLALLRGSLQIISKPNQGTSAIAEIPWRSSAEA